MDEQLRKLVRRRAGDRCEYCRLPQAAYQQSFSIDHITAKKHGGDDDADNLAFCCLRCNLHKGTDLTGIDPNTGDVVCLFNPRREQWQDHFQWRGPLVEGLTPTGRTTVNLLRMNAWERVHLRQSLDLEGML